MGGHGRLIWGEGNPQAPVVIVLDNPGAREDAEGNPFVCGTRQTLHAAVAEAGLHADDLYLTFLIRCRPRKAYDREKARRIGLRYLIEQIENRQPQCLVLLGDVVTKAVLDDTGVSVRSLRQSDLSVRGIPAIVSYHPLAARRRPNLYPLLVEDLKRVRAVLDAAAEQKS